jgi:hypothetical protein
MATIADALIEFQTMLVSMIAEITALGLLFVGLGLAMSGASPVFGYRVKRLGLQVIGACLAILIAHAVLFEVYGADVPPCILVALYGLIALLLLQAFLNLVFGLAVGNRVVADVLTSLLLSIPYLLLRPFGLIRDLFRSR